MQHEHPIEAQDRLRVLLEVNQMAFLHKLALHAQEFPCFLVEGIISETVDHQFHVNTVAANKSLEGAPVVYSQMLVEELLVVFLDLVATFLFSLVHADV